MAWVTLAREYDADFNIPAVSSPLTPCRKLDLETTAARAREIPCGRGAPLKTVPPFAPATCRIGRGKVVLHSSVLRILAPKERRRS